MLNFLFVFLGGGVGSMLRYALLTCCSYQGLSFLPPPKATLMANLLSCLLLGLFIGFNEHAILSDRSKLLFMTGFCGGFSTFSTFSGEIVSLSQSGDFISALAYLMISVIFGIGLIVIGVFLAKAFCNL